MAMMSDEHIALLRERPQMVTREHVTALIDMLEYQREATRLAMDEELKTATRKGNEISRLWSENESLKDQYASVRARYQPLVRTLILYAEEALGSLDNEDFDAARGGLKSILENAKKAMLGEP